MALVLSGSIDISGSMTATTIIVSAPGAAGMVSSSNQLVELNTATGSIKGEIAGIETYTASLKGAIEVSGQNVNVLGTLTAQEIYTTYVTSSVMFKSGSNKFGNSGDDKHEFTGSIKISGSFEVQGTDTGATVGDLLVDSINKYVYVGRQSSIGGDNTTLVLRDRTGAARATLPAGGSIDTIFTTNASNFRVTNYSGTDLFKIGNTGRAEVTGSFNVNGEIRMDGSTLFRGMSSNTLQLCGGTSSSNVKINGASEEITMDTNGVTRTLIQSDGKILTGTDTSTPTTSFKFRYNASGSNDVMAIVVAGALANNTSYIAFRTGTGEGSYKADIRYETGALSLNNMSDFRFKENIVDAPSQWNKVKNSKLRIFDWKDKTANNQLGFIAQELYQTIPEAVGKGGDEEQYDGNEKKIWTIAETKLVPAMFGALQEAMAKIEELTARIEALENK